MFRSLIMPYIVSYTILKENVVEYLQYVCHLVGIQNRLVTAHSLPDSLSLQEKVVPG